MTCQKHEWVENVSLYWHLDKFLRDDEAKETFIRDDCFICSNCGGERVITRIIKTNIKPVWWDCGSRFREVKGLTRRCFEERLLEYADYPYIIPTIEQIYCREPVECK